MGRIIDIVMVSLGTQPTELSSPNADLGHYFISSDSVSLSVIFGALCGIFVGKKVETILLILYNVLT